MIKKAKAQVCIYEVIDNFEKGKYIKPMKRFEQFGKELMNISGVDMEKMMMKNIKSDKIKMKLLKTKSKGLVEFLKPYAKGMIEFFNSVKIAKEEIFLDQTLVLTISAMEVYFKDSAIILLNNNPNLHEKFKSEIKPELNYDSLILYDYSYKHKIGNLIWDKINFFDIYEIKRIYSNLLNSDNIIPDPDIRNKIIKYSEIRHIIVHKDTKIDKKFIQKTGIRKTVGSKYRLTLLEVNEAIHNVENFVNHINGLIKVS